MFGDENCKEETLTDKGATTRLPPRNRQEWSSRNGMNQWPSDKELMQDSSNPLGILNPDEPATSLGTLKEIDKDLRDHSSEKHTITLLKNATC